MEKENIKQKIKEILNTIFDGVDSLVNIKGNLQRDIDSHRDTIETLSSRIETMNDIFDSLVNTKNEVDRYKIEISKLDKNRSDLISQIKELENELINIRLETKKTIKEAEDEYNEFIKNTQKERDFLKDERLRLDKEKVRLERKDNELKIVEKRFVKLFEGKKSAFRIS